MTQKTVDTPITSRRKVNDAVMSNSDTAALKNLFPGSPIHSGKLADGTDFTRDKIKERFKTSVISGETAQTSDFQEGVNLEFGVEDVDLTKVVTGGEGKPATPFVPNIVSPGRGSINPKDQVELPEDFTFQRADLPGSGPGTTLDPKVSGDRISNQDIDDLRLGKSGAVVQEDE